MPILEDIAEMKPDAMETFTPPAMGGDVNLGEAKRRIGDKVCMIGGFDQFHFFKGCSAQETREEVRRCFEEAGEGGGFILSPSDHFFEAEIDLLKYLHTKNILIAKPVVSNKHNFIEVTNTELGTFHAIVFERIFGEQKKIDDLEMNDFFTWGNLLGQLHKAVKEIPKEIKLKRKTHEELFEDLISKYPPQDDIEKKEISSIKKLLKTIPKRRH